MDTTNTTNTSNNNIIDNSYESILNTFIIYYKKTHTTENIKTMFDNINQDGDTNKQLELFYQSLIEYKTSAFDSAIDYTTELIKDNHDLYILTVNNKPIKLCDNIIMLLIEVINNDFADWNISDG